MVRVFELVRAVVGVLAGRAHSTGCARGCAQYILVGDINEMLYIKFYAARATVYFIHFVSKQPFCRICVLTGEEITR